ncbi:MAG: 30S ribosome-binding factor RbfA [bacterium]
MHKIRKARVESVLKREIATLVLQEIKDPRLAFATVTGVSLTDDLKVAHVYVSIMGDDEAKKRSMEALNASSGFVRKQVGDNVRMQYTPKIVFKLDNALDDRARIDRLLKEIEDAKKND